MEVLCQCMGWGDSGEHRRVYVSVSGGGIVGSRGWFMSVYGVGDSGEQRMFFLVSVWVRGMVGSRGGLCQCMRWGIVGSRGGFMSVYGVGIVGSRGGFMSVYGVGGYWGAEEGLCRCMGWGDRWEQRRVYVSVWGGG